MTERLRSPESRVAVKLSSEKRTVSFSTKSVLKLIGAGEYVTSPRLRLNLEALDGWMLRPEKVVLISADMHSQPVRISHLHRLWGEMRTSNIIDVRLLCTDHKSQGRVISGVTVSSEETTLKLGVAVAHVISDKHEDRMAGPLAIGRGKVIGVVEHHANRV